ncbi:hypothetical protein TNCV_3230121 [Trichonephila clavipes]|nr:hypothetical protein TNCV_3230121 [Trichonephila clavipes]
MPMFKITRRVGNPDFSCVVRTELATEYFGSTLLRALAEKYRNDCLQWNRCMTRKALSHTKPYLQSIDLSTQPSRKLQELQVHQTLRTFINEVLDDAASGMNLTEEERQERTF